MKTLLLVLFLAGTSHCQESHHHPRHVNGTSFTDCPLYGDCECCEENKIFCQFGEEGSVVYRGCIDYYKRFSVARLRLLRTPPGFTPTPSLGPPADPKL